MSLIEKYNQTFLGKLPPIIQLLIWVAIIFLIWRGIRYLISIFPSKGQQEEVQSINQTINTLQGQGMQPSFPDAQYATWANQLQEAFDGCGTSNQVWRNIFSKLQNDLDVAILIKTYGIRKFDECNLELDFGDFTGTLSEALVHELSESEIEEINNYLHKNNIQYRF